VRLYGNEVVKEMRCMSSMAIENGNLCWLLKVEGSIP